MHHLPRIKLILFLLIFCSLSVSFAETKIPFTIIHTNDLHSYFTGVGPDQYVSWDANESNKHPRVGHYARLSTAITSVREEARRSGQISLLVDAGDFYSGTIFHSVAPQKDMAWFPEYEFFLFHQYDAVTLGNHEFDARDDGLLVMLDKVEKAGDNRVPIISSNVYVENKNSPLAKYFGPENLIRPWHVKTYRQGKYELKVGYIGLLGPNGCLVSRGTRQSVKFKGFNDKELDSEWGELIDELATNVKYLREKEKVDIVVAMMHGGDPEDKKIAEKVKDIDVIIAGHTHQVYRDKVGKTIISQAGSYGRFLGVLNLLYDGEEVSFQEGTQGNVINIDEETPLNKDYLERMKVYRDSVNKVVEKTGYKFSTPIFQSDKDYIREKEVGNNLGQLVTTGIKEELRVHAKNPVDIFFTSLGLIRSDFKKGMDYQLSDVFKMLPIGFGEDLSPGSDVVSFYITKRELYNLITFMEMYSHVSSNFFPAFSNNVSYQIRWWGIPFINRIKNVTFNGKEYDDWPELIHVATTVYVSRYVDMVEKVTYGLVKFVPKDKNGKPISDYYKYSKKEYQLLADHLRRRQ